MNRPAFRGHNQDNGKAGVRHGAEEGGPLAAGYGAVQ